MSSAIVHLIESGDDEWVSFWCVACRQPHAIPIVRIRPLPPKKWFFDGNMQHPSFEPSLRVMTADGVGTHCHVVVTAGVLNYCMDCPNTFAGRAVSMVQWDHDTFEPVEELPPTPPPTPRAHKVVWDYGKRA